MEYGNGEELIIKPFIEYYEGERKIRLGGSSSIYQKIWVFQQQYRRIFLLL